MRKQRSLEYAHLEFLIVIYRNGLFSQFQVHISRADVFVSYME